MLHIEGSLLPLNPNSIEDKNAEVILVLNQTTQEIIEAGIIPGFNKMNLIEKLEMRKPGKIFQEKIEKSHPNQELRYIFLNKKEVTNLLNGENLGPKGDLIKNTNFSNIPVSFITK